LKDQGRAEYVAVTDTEALEGFKLLSQTEGILPALESAHAVAYLKTLVPQYGAQDIIIVNLSGRGDKDVDAVAQALEVTGAAD
ncbi:MAG: tryptophan synthase subunit beta, partial [Acidovorax sp.]|nr:tryptophan synthase subunit beta [Acidovorax sp.]